MIGARFGVDYEPMHIAGPAEAQMYYPLLRELEELEQISLREMNNLDANVRNDSYKV